MKPALPSSVFVEKRSYRRRRMMDAVRLLPVLGMLLLLMLPVFWPSDPGTAGGDVIPMSTAVIYVFVVWLILICTAYALWRILWFTRGAEPSDADTSEDAGAG